MLQLIKYFYKTHSNSTLFILACFILFWPLAIFLMWKNKKWAFKTRSVVTSVFAGLALLIGVAGYNAPPSISLSNASITTGYETDDSYTLISGEISTLHNARLLINGKSVTLSEYGNFSYKLPLNEGDTDIRIVAESDKGIDTKQFKVHRTTALEFSERKLLAEKEAQEEKKVAEARAVKARQDAIKSMPTCNGTSVKAKCVQEGVVYKTYIYHPAVAEKSHTESTTTYREEVAGYCTLCVDGTYSPTCATGRGACSHHGGVAQWNAPRIRNVPVTASRLVVDAPAKAEFYEKVTE